MRIEQYKDVLSYLKDIIEGTEFEGHLFSVGGCERDKHIKWEIKDIDLVVDLENGGIRFAKWLEEKNLTEGPVVTYENFGTAMFHLKVFPELELEIVHTRKECYRDENSRNPETSFGTLQEDCTRRDFTINAMYHDISNNKDLDLTGMGMRDLNNCLIRSCDNPSIIFGEDPLRIMRAIRFSCRLDFIIESETKNGIIENANRLSIISHERITDEFNKIISSDRPQRGLKMLKQTGILDVIIPELKDFFFADSGYNLHYHKNLYLDVNRIQFMPESTYYKDAKLIAILSLLTYHIEEGARLEFLKRFKYPNSIINDVMFNVNNVKHLHHSFNMNDEKEIRRIQMASKNIRNFTILYIAMCAIYGTLLAVDDKWMVDFEYKIPVNGNDVMIVTGCKPGKEVKEHLNKVTEAYLENPDITKQQCLDIIAGKDPFKENESRFKTLFKL